MNFWKKTKGAVSVFLVIILVPMMTVSSLFVDAGKVSLAESVAESAGDLALNTALTNYDTQLKDLYGLFATAQDTTELYERVKDYYRACITSAGVGVEEAEGYVDTLMASLGQVSAEGDTSDILNMELIDSEFNISKVVGANLANPAVLKRGIVEFMKYRAPINTGLSFLSTLTSFTTLEQQTDLVEKRTEYYEAQQGVMEQLKEAWENINAFNQSSLVVDDNYFLTMISKFSNYDEFYKTFIHDKIVKNLYDTRDHITYNIVVSSKYINEKNAAGEINVVGGWYVGIEDAKWVVDDLPTYADLYSLTAGGHDGNEYIPTVDQLTIYMNQYYQYCQAFNQAKSNLNWDMPDDVYKLQYLVQKDRSGVVDPYISTGKAMYTAYQILKNAMIWVDAYDELADSTTSTQDILNTPVEISKTSTQTETKKISEHFSEITTSYNTAMAYFFTASDQMNDIYHDNWNATDTEDANRNAHDVAYEVFEYKSFIHNEITHLTDASTDLKAVKASIEAGGTLDTAKTDWSNTANSSHLSDSDLAEQDQAEIRELDSYFSSAEIQELITLIDTIIEKLQTTITQIECYKYQDVCLDKMWTYDDVVAKLVAKAGEDTLLYVPVTEAELTAQADDLFIFSCGYFDANWFNEEGSNIQLSESGIKFYNYLYNKFNEPNVTNDSTEMKEEDPENGEDLYDSLESTASGAATEDTESATGGNTASANEISDCANLPSSGNSGAVIAPSETPKGNNAAGATSGNMGTLFGDLAEKAMDLGTDIRDNLYITDYILSMFSYDTLVAEYGKKNPGGDSSKITTLTCAPINAENNYAYGREVEYIIFGGSNTENVLKAYASIYGIRLAFNLIYAFTDSSIRDTAFAIATPISAATLGVIPVPLIQGVIIVGIACVESGIDLANLQKGEAVPLFKTAETWSCSPRGLLNAAKGLAGEALKKGAEMIVDEGALKLGELLDMTDEQLTDYMKDGESQITDYIEESYDSIITQNATVAIQKLTTLVTSTIEKNITATVDEMSAQISDQLDAWIDDEKAVSDTTSLDFIVKSEAVDIIKESFIPMAIEAISSATNDVESEISNIATALETKIADIKNKIVETIVTNPAGQVYKYKDDMVDEIRASIGEGADKLKETINSRLDGIMGSSSSGIPSASKGGTGLGQFLAFRYSDYLRLFLVIGLFAQEQGTLLRTADVIQVNMANMVTGNADYQLANSAAYLHMSATIQVKPTLLALPLFADVEGNPASNSNWYTIHYEDYKGY